MLNVKTAMVFTGALLLSACAQITDNQTPEAEESVSTSQTPASENKTKSALVKPNIITTTEVKNADLYAQSWQLTQIKGQDVVYAENYPKVDFSFDNERKMAYGYSGCNRFSAFYILVDGHVNFGPLSSTKMYCSDHAELEVSFLTEFKKTNYFEVIGNRLTLSDGNKNILLTFKTTDTKEP